MTTPNEPTPDLTHYLVCTACGSSNVRANGNCARCGVQVSSRIIIRDTQPRFRFGYLGRALRGARS